MKYTKRQIAEAIEYWERQLQTIEVLDSCISQMNESKSEDIAEMNQLKNDIQQNVKNANDVRKFIATNDAKVMNTSNSKLKTAWNSLKSIVAKGSKFLYKHWKIAILVILVATIAINPSGALKIAGWLFDKILQFIMWILGYDEGYDPETTKTLIDVSGNVPEEGFKKVIDKYNNKPWFDDGTVGTF